MPGPTPLLGTCLAVALAQAQQAAAVGTKRRGSFKSGLKCPFLNFLGGSQRLFPPPAEQANPPLPSPPASPPTCRALPRKSRDTSANRAKSSDAVDPRAPGGDMAVLVGSHVGWRHGHRQRDRGGPVAGVTPLALAARHLQEERVWGGGWDPGLRVPQAGGLLPLERVPAGVGAVGL